MFSNKSTIVSIPFINTTSIAKMIKKFLYAAIVTEKGQEKTFPKNGTSV